MRANPTGGNQRLGETEGVVRESRGGYAEGWRERRWRGEKLYGQTILGPSRSNQGLEDTAFLP